MDIKKSKSLKLLKKLIKHPQAAYIINVTKRKARCLFKAYKSYKKAMILGF